MDHLVSKLRDGVSLSREEAQTAAGQLLDEGIAHEVKADFLLALRAKGETAAEMAGFAEALLARALEPGIDPAQLPGPIIDVCGTGGDRLELFNISTASMFILAAGGAVVVKHGNRAITSQCGGADVLEALGARIELPPADLRRCVETLGLGFVFAPAYHPAFQVIGPVRKALAARGHATIFNLLGPILNPVRPARQLVGVFLAKALPVYAETLQTLGRSRAWAVHGDGMDEISITAPSLAADVTRDNISQFTIDPRELGLEPAPIESLRGGNKAVNAAILEGILAGEEAGPKRDITLLNAAAGFVVAELAPDLANGLELAREQLASGRALAKLRALQAFR